MKLTAPPPLLSELIEAGVGALEIICQEPTCRRQTILEADAFKPTETMLRIRAKARCSLCGARRAEIFPVWNRTDMFGKQISTYSN